MRSVMPLGAPKVGELGAQAARFLARFGAQQIVDRRVELGEARRQLRDDLARLGVGRGAAQQIGDVQLQAGRGLLEQSEADLLGHRGIVELVPTSAGMSNKRSAATKAAAAWPKEAPSSSVSAKGAMMPSRLTMRLAILVAMISHFSRWARSASRCRSCIAGGKAASNSGTRVGIVGEARRLDRALQAHLRGGEQDGQLGPGQALIGLGAAQQFLVACRALRRRG